MNETTIQALRFVKETICLRKSSALVPITKQIILAVRQAHFALTVREFS